MSYARNDGRAANELRPVKITPGFLPYAEGSRDPTPDRAQYQSGSQHATAGRTYDHA